MKVNYIVEAISPCGVELKVFRNDQKVFSKMFSALDLPVMDYMFGNFVSTDEERLEKLYKIAQQQGKNYIDIMIVQEAGNEF